MRSLSSSWQYRNKTFDWFSEDLTSRDIFLRFQERTVPRTGYLICLAKIVERSRSIFLAISSSLGISGFASKWIVSVIMIIFCLMRTPVSLIQTRGLFLLYTADNDQYWCLFWKCGRLRPIPRHLPLDQLVHWLRLIFRDLFLRCLKNW